MFKDFTPDECLICFDTLHKDKSIYQLWSYTPVCGKCSSLFISNLEIKLFQKIPIITLYQYTRQASQILIRYKDFYDLDLAPIFLYHYNFIINLLLSDYLLVPIPSSRSKQEERGFHHLELMLQGLDLKKVNALSKLGSGLQRNLDFNDRQKIEFDLTNMEAVRNKKIVIFDDVITSGSSVLAAIKLLQPYCKKIIVICVFASKYFSAERSFIL